MLLYIFILFHDHISFLRFISNCHAFLFQLRLSLQRNGGSPFGRTHNAGNVTFMLVRDSHMRSRERFFILCDFKDFTEFCLSFSIVFGIAKSPA